MKTVLCWILASAAALTAVTTKLSGNGDGNLMPATSPDSMPGTFQREAGMDIIVFAGDSVGRNQWESLLCMLASGVSNISTIYEVKGKSINKHKGYFSMKFPNFNLTVEYYRTSFLSLLAFPPLTSPSQVQKIIKLDKLHWFSHMWVGAHVLVFNSDHWGCYFQEGANVNMSMDVNEAFRRSVQTWKSWALNSLDPDKSFIFFRIFPYTL